MLIKNNKFRFHFFAVLSLIVFFQTCVFASPKNPFLTQHLELFFQQASELSKHGASLEHFSYSINQPSYKKTECTPIENKFARTYLNNLSELIMTELGPEANTDLLTSDTLKAFQQNLIVANRDWQLMVNQGPLQFCQKSKSEAYSWTQNESFIFANFTMTFEYGYED